MTQFFKYNEHFTIVSIEGNIGSGKSTLLERLRAEFKDNKYIREDGYKTIQFIIFMFGYRNSF